ncbi:MAG TPA: prenyltransferase/squalene oxidase repeat-containing protein, partial [Streptosporangiaceae bacterium]
MPPAARSRMRARVLAPAAIAFAAAGISLGLPAPRASAVPAAPAAGPDLVQGSAYLAAPANLIGGHYYQSFPRFADFGLTLDGAFALAATGDQDSALKGIVAFLDGDGKDPSGNTVNAWTGIGTRFASGGSIGKEALLAEMVGDNPRDFSGHDLIAALNASVCARASAGSNTSCAGAGNYTYSTSVFSQSLGIIAQLRAGQPASAAAPVGYLERLRHADGSFPSLIPPTGDHDVDSTAIAAMALALVPGAAAAADVSSALAWIASRQEANGGFPGTGGDSVNSAGLALQALTLQASRYQPQISAARRFLASEQNGDGGFNADATGQRGSDVRASAQALGGAVGTSFGTLHRDLTGTATPTPTPTPTRSSGRRPVTAPAPSPAAAVPPSAPGPAAPTATPSGTPARQASSSTIFPNGATITPAHPHLADVGHDSSLATALWWAALAVAIAAALVIAVLLRRRRRLYPPASRGRRATPAGR